MPSQPRNPIFSPTADTILATVECLDSMSMQWTTQTAQMITARKLFGAAVIEHTIYIVGGYRDSGTDIGNSMESLDMSDPATTWVERPDMPTSRWYLAATSAGTKLYVVGGNSGGANKLEIFDTTVDTWSTGSPMPTARGGLSAAIVGNTLMAMGGTGRMDTVELREPDIAAKTALRSCLPR